ncbi:MAG: hypothetical protein AB2A00_01345 [Myxococcota bacterium]
MAAVKERAAGAWAVAAVVPLMANLTVAQAVAWSGVILLVTVLVRAVPLRAVAVGWMAETFTGCPAPSSAGAALVVDDVRATVMVAVVAPLLTLGMPTSLRTGGVAFVVAAALSTLLRRTP